MSEASNTWQARLRAATVPLPGLQPYDNTLRVGVSQRFEGLSLAAFLAQRHPGQAAEGFHDAVSEGRLRIDGRKVPSLEGTVVAGQLVSMDYLETGEPTVATDLVPLYEDDDLLAVAKPAPLPVHPSGRYNRHTLLAFLHAMFPGQRFRPVHRLDADTTGVLALAKSATAARALSLQFRERRVHKTYLARVEGSPAWDRAELVHSIGAQRLEQGAREVKTAAGGEGKPGAFKAARCLAEVLARSACHSLLALEPETGRTNQLRLQLAAEGVPISGDAAYGASAAQGSAFSGHPLQLHAWRLELDHPSSGERLLLEAPRPSWAEFEATR